MPIRSRPQREPQTPRADPLPAHISRFPTSCPTCDVCFYEDKYWARFGAITTEHHGDGEFDIPGFNFQQQVRAVASARCVVSG